MDKAVYGKSETKKSIDKIVGMVMQRYNCTSLIELNAALSQFNVMADRGNEGTTMHQKNGLLYWILDDKGNKIGVPIKASALVSQPTMKNLQSKFQVNEQLRPIYKARLTEIIDSFFLRTDHHTRANFHDYLNSYGISPIFRENDDGKIYGITFIDNRKGAVINGSELGKKYSGQALAKQFNHGTAGERERPEREEPRHVLPQLERYGHWASSPIQNTATQFLNFMKMEKSHSEPINPHLKRRKKKKRKMSP